MLNVVKARHYCVSEIIRVCSDFSAKMLPNMLPKFSSSKKELIRSN